MTLSGARKRCPSCKNQMQRWGTHPSGTKRWRCADCRIHATRTRKDNHLRRRLSLFVMWLTTKSTLQQVAKETGVSTQTLHAWFRPLWTDSPKPVPITNVRVLVLDGTSVVHRQCMLLIAGDADRIKPVSWLPVGREAYDTWHAFLHKLFLDGTQPPVVVCDGQRGLLKAIHEVWPATKIQRCLVHVIRQSCAWLTQNPKTRAGRELLVLVQKLSTIRTKRQKRRWIRAFRYWYRKHDRFLKERTYASTGHWWYTHRKLRGTRSLLRNAIPDLFRFVTDPSIPRTSNHVEGGLNARIKELFRCHRGFRPNKKVALASWYLALRQGQKPTRNFL